MAGIHKLTPKEIEHGAGPWLSDGGNLLMKVSGRSRVWFFRYKVDGKQIPMSLGSYPEVSVKDARKKAADYRKVLADGGDPRQDRETRRTEIAVAAAKTVTFDAARDQYIATRSRWSDKYKSSWKASLETYASPILGHLPVGSVDEALVHKVLDPIWTVLPETGHRVRGRLETVLSFATVRKYRTGANPATWRGNLEHAYEARDPATHHKSLPYAKLPAFMAELRQRDGDAPLALMFTILTGVRASEAVEAVWGEIDLEAKLWTIPAKRMKMDREHKVPLSAAVIGILRTMLRSSSGVGPVFPGRDGGSMTTAAMLVLIKRMRPELTVHGFRSTLRIWAEENGADSRVAEMALAHVVGSKVEQAYLRGAEMFAKRRELMNEWAGYATGIKSVKRDAA